jgi:GNAT superfamily N-acetyltransferase
MKDYSCFKYTTGDVEESKSIIMEAAQWLADSGKAMWNMDEIKGIKNPSEEFIVMWENEKSVATLLLSFEDKLFWPNIPRNESGYIHKLSIRRKYAGLGYSKCIVQYACQLCRDRDIEYIRLDCDAKRKALRSFYKDLGFSLTEIRRFNSQRLGMIEAAMYEMRLI